MAADERCVIGKGIFIKGSLRGAEDVVLQGRLEGSVELMHHLTVDKGAQLQAQVVVAAASIHGQVGGRLQAEDFVVLHEGANVMADLKAPRIVIEDGARFTGRIDMDVQLPADV